MIISFFRNNRPSTYFILPIIAIALWLLALVSAQIIPMDNFMPFFKSLYNLLFNFPFFYVLSALLIVIINAFLINYAVNEHEIFDKRSFLPAFIYILLMSNNLQIQTLHPAHIASTFLLFSLILLFGSYRKDVAFSSMFNAGLLFALATLFYFPLVMCFPILWISIAILRPFIWREWIIALIGFLFPYIYVFSYYFFTDNIPELINLLMNSIHLSAKDFNQYFNLDFLSFAVIVILFLFMLLSPLNAKSSRGQKTQKTNLIFVLLFVLIIGLIFVEKQLHKNMVLLALPMTIGVSRYFLYVKKTKWAEFLLFMLLITIIFQQVYNFL